MEAWKTSYEARTDLDKYGDNAIGLFALALKFGIDDLETVAAESVTDGSGDKKCDIIYVNKDDGIAVISQCYFSKTAKDEAPANKASDLNTAIGWLLQRPLKDLPERIYSAAQEVRDGIRAGNLKEIYIWYVHNLSESENVKQELITVEATAKAAIETNFAGLKVTVKCLEVGNGTMNDWYAETQTPILVNEKFDINIEKGFDENGPSWSAFITSIPATFLHRTYKKYRTKLFSANVRDYLGSRATDSNINNNIKKTIESDHSNFWVYNNGLTILVNNYEYDDASNVLKIEGISIVNGAQTTGAVGSLSKLPAKEARIPARFVKTKEKDIVLNIIRYNNSQNKVTASDFRSTDKIQKRLKEQISKIPNAEYEGGRRGGFGDAIARRPNLLSSYTAGQALAAFHGDTIIAYNQKSNIWVDDKIYSKYFNEHTSGPHLVCAYGLLRAVENKKIELVNKSKKSESSLTSNEENQLSFFRKRGSIYLYVSAIAACLETFVGKKIPNKFRISFSDKTSPKKSQELWEKVVEVNLPLCNQLEVALTDGLKSNEKVNKAIQTFQGLVQVTIAANKTIYDDFSKKIVTS